MTHTYNVTGMTCTGCQAKVQGLLSKIEGVTNVSINLQKATADIEMSKHISITTFKLSLQDYPKYQITEAETKTWVATYKPILLIFTYITTIALIVSCKQNTIHWMDAMRVFMAGFFLTFSFFKMLNLKGFAESYAMYDIVGKQWHNWGYLYAFIELALGILYAINFHSLVTNIVTLLVMALSIIGVLQSVLNKRKIKCACLGDVFNLPMSTITIIEDGLMISMSGMIILTMM